MNVSKVGAAPTGAELPSAPPGLARTQGYDLIALAGLAQSGVAITATLRDLSELDLVRLLELIERPLPVENTARLEALLRTSVAEVAEGNVRGALSKLAEFAALDPGRAESLLTEPGLAGIRADVRHLLFQLASAAQLDAETRLGQGTRLLQAAVSEKLPQHEINPEIVLLIASRLLDAGGYANCVRSAELSQMTINLFGAPTPAPVYLSDPRSITIGSTHDERDQRGGRNKWVPRIGKLWQRAPLLVLLLAWFAVGLAAASVSAIMQIRWPHSWPTFLLAEFLRVWPLGFLALILFGFYARVRNARR